MQSILDAASGLACDIVSFLLVLTIILLILTRRVPTIGVPLWNGYRRVLVWLAFAPFRLTRFLIREALGRRPSRRG